MCSVVLEVILSNIFSQPPNLSSILPLTLLLMAVLAYINPDAVLFACFPIPDVLSPISPNELSLSLALVIDKIAFILLAVLPSQDSLAIHFVFLPVSCVGLAVRPIVVSEATDFILLELALVVTSISESQSALTFLFAIYVLTFIACSIGP